MAYTARSHCLLFATLVLAGLLLTPAVVANAAEQSTRVVAAGDIVECGSDGYVQTADLVESLNPALVLPLGDLVYPAGSLDDFQNCYDPTWGRFREVSRPATGNHEYMTPDASGFSGYFGDVAAPGLGYSSFDSGGWHVVVLNSNCDDIGGCGVDSPQGQWLAADLAANPTTCLWPRCITRGSVPVNMARFRR